MAAGAALAGVEIATEALGMVTFLNFIHEETIQTCLMSIYIAHKNKIGGKARLKVLHELDNAIAEGHSYNESFGMLAPWAQGAFRQFYAAAKASRDMYLRIFEKEGMEGRVLEKYFVPPGFYHKPTKYFTTDEAKFIDHLKVEGVIVEDAVDAAALEEYKIGDQFYHEPSKFQTAFLDQFIAHLKSIGVYTDLDVEHRTAMLYWRDEGYYFPEDKFHTTQAWRFIQHLRDNNYNLHKLVVEPGYLPLKV